MFIIHKYDQTNRETKQKRRMDKACGQQYPWHAGVDPTPKTLGLQEVWLVGNLPSPHSHLLSVACQLFPEPEEEAKGRLWGKKKWVGISERGDLRFKRSFSKLKYVSEKLHLL